MGGILAKFGLEGRGDEIAQTYDRVNEVLQELDTLHSAIMQKHEADFVLSYKDHMMQV